MRLTKRRRSTRPDMDMTPMIDIVFLLIIFFMTVTQVSKVNKEQLDLAKQKGSEDQQTATLTINVNADGEYRVAGNQVSLAQLVSLASQELNALAGQLQLEALLIHRLDEPAAFLLVDLETGPKNPVRFFLQYQSTHGSFSIPCVRCIPWLTPSVQHCCLKLDLIAPSLGIQGL